MSEKITVGPVPSHPDGHPEKGDGSDVGLEFERFDEDSFLVRFDGCFVVGQDRKAKLIKSMDDLLREIDEP